MRLLTVTAAGALLLVLTGFSTGPARTSDHTVQVVAAENVWGSIAAQVGGAHAHVASIISKPTTDPHDYEPTAFDARTLAGAKLVIVNGAGYDAWASKLLAANPVKDRIVIDVSKLVGVKKGGNPHTWYSPKDVARVIAALSRAYQQLDPGDAASFVQTTTFFSRIGLFAYHSEIARIRSRFHGTKVGASESIFAPLAAALHLNLITPPSFLNAVSEGSEPTAHDLATIGHQIKTHQFKLWVVNSQNSTPDLRRLTKAARKQGIRVATITETPAPPQATFQAWQVAQLRALEQSLAAAEQK